VNKELEIVLRLVLAAVLGGIIGFQREKSGKPAGLRTMILISLGAALFTVVGTFGFIGGDPSRIAAGIVTGVGFLGAGTIFHHRQIIEGLTTAAAMWVAAAIGLASGAGFYIIAPAAAILTFIVLMLPHRGPPH
jgi:putative Mg2+ transporter-C (MgtC) family protein